MKSPIPVIGSLSLKELSRYIVLLNERLPDEIFVNGSSLSAAEKAKCDVAVVANPDPTELKQYTSLIWIHSVWAGVEKLVANLLNKDVKIVRLVDPNLAEVMSEAVLAWTLYLHRDMPTYATQQRQKEWKSLKYCLPQNRHVGILGLGELGKASASRLVQNDFKVLGWSRQEKHIEGVSCFYGDSGLEQLLSRTNILISLLPLTPQTHHLLNHDNLCQLPPNSAVINFSRGEIVHIDSLIELLDNRHISHAVLDVFDQEPLPKNSDLWSHPNITILPHISAPTVPESACEIVVENIKQYRQTGLIPPHVDLKKAY